MNEHHPDPLEAARRAVDEMERPSPARPVLPVADEGSEEARDFEAELRSLIEGDEAVRDATHADAWTAVARMLQRLGREPTVFRPYAASTAIAISRLLLALADLAIVEDPAFTPMSEAEALAELEKAKRSAPAFKALAGLAR